MARPVTKSDPLDRLSAEVFKLLDLNERARKRHDLAKYVVEAFYAGAQYGIDRAEAAYLKRPTPAPKRPTHQIEMVWLIADVAEDEAEATEEPATATGLHRSCRASALP